MSIGERAAVLDATSRVTGGIPFLLNQVEPGCLSGKLLRSPHPHARIVRVDVSRAVALPDVTVLTGDDVQAWPGLTPFFGPLVADTPVLAAGVVRYSGEPVVAVAAPDDDAADEALANIDVEYEPLDPVLDARAALDAGGARSFEPFTIHTGDVETALAAADLVLTEEYATPPVHGVPLEPHVVIAKVVDSTLVVYSATQTPDVVRSQLSRIFGLPLARVRVIGAPLGGGFGAKAYPRLEPVAALLAMTAQRAVKLVLTRAEEFVTTQRPAAWFRLTSGAARDGSLVALQAEAVFSCGAYTETIPRVLRHAAAGLVGPYHIPNVDVIVHGVFTNTPPCGPLRAPGGAQAHWARESHVDSIAVALELDPLDIRSRNLARNGDRFALGGPLEDLHYQELLDAARKSQAASSGRGRGYALSLVLINTPTTSTASLKLNDDGSLNVLTSSVDMGQGAHTVLAQIAAHELRIGIDRVRVSHPDTAITPFDHATTSSRTTFVMGTAVARAAGSVKQQLLELAAELLEASVADLEVGDGRVGVRGVPERSLSYADIVRGTRSGNLLGHGSFTTRASTDVETGEPGASAQYHQAVCGAEVKVDLDTGKVHVKRLFGAAFAGRMVNPTLCELQAEGNLVQGVGQALFEELVYDGGQLTNPGLADYTIPACRDLPATLEIEHLEDLDGETVHGIGETLLPAVAPALANAVYDACGARVRDLPMTAEKVLRALRERT